MFERFSREARAAVVRARERAAEAASPQVLPEHLLLALRHRDDDVGRYLVDRLAEESTLAERFGRVRRRAGITSADAQALEGLGIDVDHVVEAVERVHGENALVGDRAGSWRRRTTPGTPRRTTLHIPLAAESKQVLVQCLKETAVVRDRRIRTEHLLLALLATSGVVSDVASEDGVDHLDARRALRGPGQTRAG